MRITLIYEFSIALLLENVKEKMRIICIYYSNKKQPFIDKGCLRLFGGIRCFNIGPSKKIISTDFIVICKCVNGCYRNVQFTQFIIGICGLMNLKELCHIFLF